MKACPNCAEQIQDAARFCRYCRQPLDSPPPVSPGRMRSARPPRAKDHPSYGPRSALAFMLPAIGLIVGVIDMLRGSPVERKLGEHEIVVSFLGGVFWFLALAWFGGMLAMQ